MLHAIMMPRGRDGKFTHVLAGLAICVASAAPAQVVRAQTTDSTGRTAAWVAHQRLAAASPFRGLEWRADGPVKIGARVEAVAVPRGDNGTIYVGVGTGGVWKTLNNGLTWRPIFDHQSAFAIGDIAVSNSNPDIVWVATGEAQPRYTGYSYPGTGVFKSTDAGATWTHMGLSDSHHIAKVIIHPTNPDVVYVASMGHQWTPNGERGVFRTTDGGAHWTRSLFINDSTGVVDMAMDPRDPNILYAWAWHIESGTDGGLYRTTDGGGHWTHVTAGLPTGPVGRAGIDVAPSDPNVVYLFVDDRAPSSVRNRDFVGGEVYRSNDRGRTWHKAGTQDLYDVFGEYGWKFADVRVSPSDPNDVFILGNHGFHSRDGGRTWSRIGDRILRLHDTDGLALHLDQHEIWIDPMNPRRVLLGNDGGLFESYDEGESWLHLNNIPVVQMYFVTTDNAVPYNIFAGTQDDAAIYGPSNSSVDDAVPDSWRSVYLDPWTGGDSFVTFPDPTNSRLVYYEHQNGAIRRMDLDGISVNSFGPSSTDLHPRLVPRDKSLRFSWYTPFFVSHFDPYTLYAGGSRVLKSTDRGASWTAISGDLGNEAGGNRALVPTGAATMLAESSTRRGTLIMGTEGGSLWRTIDDGAHWKRIGAGLPRKWVSRVTISDRRPNTVYVSFTGFREDDTHPYIFVSDDLGDTWRSISAGLPMEAVNVIKEDPSNPEILFAGTDGGVYVSLDRGGNWASLSATLTTTPVQDLTIQARERELVIGSYGRGAWILDIAPVEWYADSSASRAARTTLHVFQPRSVKLDYFPWERAPGETRRGRPSARISFYAPDSGSATITVRDSTGSVLRQLESAAVAGMNTAVWDLQVTPAVRNRPQDALVDAGAGIYEIEVEVNGRKDSTRLTLLPVQ